jgi:putative ABC transport system permease protein
LLLAGFAEAHGIVPGDRLEVVINGRVRKLWIVGLAMSPEHVLTMPPGAMTYDPKRFAVFWMNQSAVSAAFDMQGAFSDVVFSLQPGADRAGLVTRVERLLAPYGGGTAIVRDKQPSNYMITGELQQLEQMATTVPVIFLLVAAF